MVDSTLPDKALVTQVRQRSAGMSAPRVLRRMGYPRLEPRTLERLAWVLSDPMLGLEQARYDFRYTASQFAHALCEALSIDAALASEGLAAMQARVNRRNAFAPYLFVNTNFRRATQPLFAIAIMEGHRHVGFRRPFRDFDDSTQIDVASARAREHYAAMDGTVPMWGAIQGYEFHQTPERVYVMNIHGAVIRKKESSVTPRATLRYRDKKLDLFLRTKLSDESS